MYGFTYPYAFARTKWFTKIFVDCNRFNKGELNKVLNGPLKKMQE